MVYNSWVSMIITADLLCISGSNMGASGHRFKTSACQGLLQMERVEEKMCLSLNMDSNPSPVGSDGKGEDTTLSIPCCLLLPES